MYAGANGAGKSTLRGGGIDPVEIEIDPDRIARELKSQNPRSVDIAAGKEALRRFDQAIREGHSLSLETTLTGRTIFARIQAAKRAGYFIYFRYVGIRDADLNIERVQARALKSGHWINPNVVRRRVQGSLANLPEAIAITDRSVLLDNTAATHRRVLEVERGRLIFVASDLPHWLVGQLPRIEAALQHDPSSPPLPRLPPRSPPAPG